MYVEGLGTCALPGLGFRGVGGHDCDALLLHLAIGALPLEGVSFRWGGGYFLKRVSAALERGAALSMNRFRLRQHTFLFCHAAGSVVGTPRALLGQPVLYFCPRFCGYVSLFPVRRSLFLGRRVLVVVRWLVGNTFEFCPCTDVVWLFGPQNVNVCRPACLASTPCGAEGAVFE